MIWILSQEAGQLMVALHKSPLFGQEERVKLPEYQRPYQTNQVEDRQALFQRISRNCHPGSNCELLGCLAVV